MAIFSRRDIQAAIDHLADSLSKEQLNALVGNLNGPKAIQSLAAEWEVVLLSAFRQVGRIQYEKDFGGQRRPDLFFQMGLSGMFEFAADITTVSDVDAHERNPYEEFLDAIQRFLKKLGRTSAGLHIDVKHEEIGEFGDQKIRLCLPERGEIETFVKNELSVFLLRITREPDKDASYSYDRNGIRFAIRYDSGEKRFSSGGHILYTVPYSARRNPLIYALKNKASQLSKSTYRGPHGIIVCDGDSDALRERNPVSGAHGCKEIVAPFLRSHQSVLFVLVLRIEESHGVYGSHHKVQIIPKVYWNPSAKTLREATATALNRMIKGLPNPESTPGNAVRRLNSPNKHLGHLLGVTSMQGNTIRISARAITELLAGKVEVRHFLEEHGLKPVYTGDHAFPFFERQLQRGNTLRNAFVEREKHKDDDWLVLEYDGPDPAISPYRLPK